MVSRRTSAAVALAGYDGFGTIGHERVASTKVARLDVLAVEVQPNGAVLHEMAVAIKFRCAQPAGISMLGFTGLGTPWGKAVIILAKVATEHAHPMCVVVCRLSTPACRATQQLARAPRADVERVGGPEGVNAPNE